MDSQSKELKGIKKYVDSFPNIPIVQTIWEFTLSGCSQIVINPGKNLSKLRDAYVGKAMDILNRKSNS